MPRDLGFDDHHAGPFQDLALHPEASLGIHTTNSSELEDEEENGFAEPGILDEVDIVGEAGEILKQLHPYAQILSIADAESCVKLEDTAFDEGERAPRDKFFYNLTRCSELCLGLFTSAGPESPEQEALTASTAQATDSHDPERKTVLIAMIVATKSTNDRVTEDDMKTPPNWEDGANEESPKGHQEHGRTLIVHTLAVLPEYQTRGLGSILMKAYIQRMVEAETADRIALLARDRLIPFYENLGFVTRGKSDVKFGGGGYNNMVLEFDDVRPVIEDDE